MNPDPATTCFEHRRPARLTACVAWLSAVVLVTYPIVGGFAHVRHGASGWVAAAVAAGLCWLGATAALVLSAAMRGPGGAVNGVLLSMMARLGVPLVGGFLLNEIGGPLVDAGVIGYLVVYYFVTLIVETLLSLRLVDPAAR